MGWFDEQIRARRKADRTAFEDAFRTIADAVAGRRPGGAGRDERQITEDAIHMVLADHGPGIENVELAMKEGYSTAPDNIRCLGFGAGMGLPNIKKYSDEFRLETALGVGTTLYLTVYMK